MILLLIAAGVASLAISFVSNEQAFRQARRQNRASAYTLGFVTVLGAPLGVACFVVAYAIASRSQ